MKGNIVLLGYMGSGKSAVGRVLAEKSNLDFIDLDDYIEQKEQKKISAIFSEKGEIYFRKLETKYLKELINDKSNFILSLGGGTPCFGDNMKLVNSSESTFSIYLQTSIKELTTRLYSERAKRPLIAHTKTKDELSEFIAKHLFERSAYYSNAKYILKTDVKSISEIADEILTIKIT